ncbi:right-handed parallel beta-helix repeat-containing protein [Liquorilactobacillus mali]|nr:right-handed parallel beta-helix repeat-containing protein [Liquorilactobacillus mali]
MASDTTTNNFPSDYNTAEVDSRVLLRSKSVRNKTYGKDVREALAQGIEIGSAVSSEANNTANSAKKQSQNIDDRFNDQIAGSTNDNETIDFRHSDLLSKSFITAKLRGDFWDIEFQQRAVNVKWFGAAGDGTTDDSGAFQEAIDSGYQIFVPIGNYKFGKTVNVTDTTYARIVGATQTSFWNNSINKSVIISPDDDYAFTGTTDDGGKSAIEFSHIVFKGKGLNGLNGSILDTCEFTGDTGIENGKTLVIDKCTFQNCTTAGIVQLTDTRVVNSDFYSNGTGLQLDSSNDNIISNNRIEWNNIGMSIQGNYNLIFGNNFDRNTQYGLYINQLKYTKFYGNHFERNLEAHVYFYYGSQISFKDNNLVSKHTDDNDTSGIGPNVAIKIHYLENSILSDNEVTLPANGQVFEKDGDTADVNLTVKDFIVNGMDLENINIEFSSSIIVPAQTTGTFSATISDIENSYKLSNVDKTYIELGKYAISLNNNSYSENLKVSVGINSNGDVFLSYKNDTDASVTLNSAEVSLRLNYLGLLNVKFVEGGI